MAAGCSFNPSGRLSEAGVADGDIMPDSSTPRDGAVDAAAIDATIDSAPCVPMSEVCNGVDDNCDGTPDEGSLCAANQTCQGISGCLCNSGWDDCDPNVAGCETDVLADSANCGGCNVPCTSGPRWQCVAAGCRDRCDPYQCVLRFGCPLQAQCYDDVCGDACPSA